MAYTQEGAAAPKDSVVDVDSMRFYRALNDCGQLAWIENDADESLIYRQEFQQDLIGRFQLRIPDRILEKTLLVRFILTNTGDTAKRVYFTPGFYTRSIEMFRADPADIAGSFQRIADSASKSKYFEGSRMLSVHPGDTTVYFARFKMLRTNSNNFLARIIEEDFLGSWLHARKISDNPQDIVTYVVTGILMLMIIYSLAVYLQNKGKEFIFYSGYALCTAALLFLKAYYNQKYSLFNFFFEEYLDFMIMGGGAFFYLLFVRKFLDTQKNHLFLENFLRFSAVLLVILLTAFSVIYFFTDRYLVLNLMENYIIKFFLLIIGVTFIVYSIKRKDRLLNYLAAGNIALVFFSLVSLYVMLVKPRIVEGDATHILNRSLFYYELGLVLELTCFLAGLAYKNRSELIVQVKEKERIKLENERQEFEKQMAVMAAQQEERNRISADMHDDLGSGVTAIRLMSEIVKSKMKGFELPEIDKISNSANELLGKMNTIIWTMKSSNDSLESLAAYIRAYAIDFFDGTPVNCVVNVTIAENIEISGEKRRNIFLSLKEALTNIVKHANATEVVIDFESTKGPVIIKIRDNGKGIDTENLRRFGNGLSNMRRRMQLLNAAFSVESNGGTLLTFSIPVNSGRSEPVDEPV